MLYKLYKKQVEAWKERFDSTIQNFHDDELPHDGLHCPCTCIHEEDRKKIKSFISSSRHKDTIELIEAEIERKRGMKTSEVFTSSQDAYNTACNTFSKLSGNWSSIEEFYALAKSDMTKLQNAGYNSAIDEDIAYLEENLQKIKKEL